MLKTKHGLSFAVAAVSVLLLVACGDDNSTKASDKVVVDSVEDLSNCVATKVGNLEYVDTVAYVCVELGDKIKWVQVAGVEDNSEDFRACTGKKDGLYSFSPKENTLYVCNDEEWVPVKQLDDNDSMEESSSSSAKSSSSSSAKSSSSEKSSGSTKSSSSEAKSSSSSVTPQSSDSETSVSSSSSVTGRTSCDVNTDKNCFMDSRDGQTYKTVTIGTQTWMAQNLNYAYTDVPYKYEDNTSDSTSWCYKDDANNCSKYGRLYTWAAAMDSVGTWSTNGKGCGYNKTCSPTYPVRGVCPEGWHLPTLAEFETLFTAVGGRSTAGKVLKSTSGWNSSGNASDAFAFSALPAGYRGYDGSYDFEGYYAYFWSSTERGSYGAYDMGLYYDYDGADLHAGNKFYGFSVRCLKDEGTTPQSSSSTSSVTGRTSCDVNTDKNCFMDSRDGQTYKTVTIGTQTWMAQNLNYAYTDVPYKSGDNTSDSTSWCYMDDASYCTKYGRLYTWAAATTACPEGWHLPTKAEFETLFTAVGGQSTAGKMLKSATGWKAYGGITNEDAFAFSALPAGYRSYYGDYYHEGDYARFWSSTEYDSYYAYYMSLYYYYDDAGLSNGKDNGISVRCLKD